MMKPHSQFIKRIGFVFDPIGRVVNRFSKFSFNQMGLYAKIAFRRPKLSGPPSDAIEHAAMQAL